MLEDMQVRNLSPHTQRAYVENVARFARHFGRSPASGDQRSRPAGNQGGVRAIGDGVRLGVLCHPILSLGLGQHRFFDEM